MVFLVIAKDSELMVAVLAVLAAPAAVATEAACRGASPVEAVCFVLPGRVVGYVVTDFAEPVPRAGVEDVLEAGDFGLGEDGGELVDDAEGVGAFEEAKRR